MSEHLDKLKEQFNNEDPDLFKGMHQQLNEACNMLGMSLEDFEGREVSYEEILENLLKSNKAMGEILEGVDHPIWYKFEKNLKSYTITLDYEQHPDLYFVRATKKALAVVRDNYTNAASFKVSEWAERLYHIKSNELRNNFVKACFKDKPEEQELLLNKLESLEYSNDSRLEAMDNKIKGMFAEVLERVFSHDINHRLYSEICVMAGDTRQDFDIIWQAIEDKVEEELQANASLA